jgi:hypothetical protein
MARGTVGGPLPGAQANMEVLVDGVSQGVVTVTSSLETYVFGVPNLGDASTLEVRFPNDANGPAGDRNLFVVKVETTIDGTTEELDIPSALYERDSGSDLPGQTGLYWGGELNFDLDGPPPADDLISVMARGSVGGPLPGAQADMEVLVDGVSQGVVTVTGSLETYVFNVPALGDASTLEVRFPNDANGPAGDRNLIVQTVEAIIDGAIEELDIASAIYERDSGGDLPGQTGLYWGGELSFDLGAPPPVGDVIAVEARGTVGGPLPGAQADLEVLVDGVSQGVFTMTGALDTYVFNVPDLDDASTLEVRFPNDARGPAGDRNLIVQTVEAIIDGATEELDIASAIYERDSLGDLAGQNGLYWQGELNFDLDTLLT